MGVVVHIYPQAQAYEVEFMTDEGLTLGVHTLLPEDLIQAVENLCAKGGSSIKSIEISAPAETRPLVSSNSCTMMSSLAWRRCQDSASVTSPGTSLDVVTHTLATRSQAAHTLT